MEEDVSNSNLQINPLGQRDTLLSNHFTHVSLRVLEIVLDVGNAVRPILHHQCPITWLQR